MMNKLARIAIASAVATTGMTLFSSLVSRVRKKEFEEPDLLNLLMQRAGMPVDKDDSHGWWLHYVAGAGFGAANYAAMKLCHIKPDVKNGALLGALDGIAGIATWQVVLHKHPNPPRIDRQEYFLQLFFAHVVFGALFNAALSRRDDIEVVE